MVNPREYTFAVLEAMDNGYIDPEVLAETAVHFMSEADVKEMCEKSDMMRFLFSQEDEEDEDDEDMI